MTSRLSAAHGENMGVIINNYSSIITINSAQLGYVMYISIFVEY